MYRYSNGQISLTVFHQPMGIRLMEDNRRLRKAQLIPWDKMKRSMQTFSRQPPETLPSHYNWCSERALSNRSMDIPMRKWRCRFSELRICNIYADIPVLTIANRRLSHLPWCIFINVLRRRSLQISMRW